ncbi:hypothetical protein H920_09288 [Fukomys damarensis]|uniref:Uncharacterized protein n=1 Tax=Fukomys damarensis TaxID=885580 RepID=A0A091E2P9_FUKDA|nr:hypothetical protein H920_09288 [Fukomys damarensis]
MELDPEGPSVLKAALEQACHSLHIHAIPGQHTSVRVGTELRWLCRDQVRCGSELVPHNPADVQKAAGIASDFGCGTGAQEALPGHRRSPCAWSAPKMRFGENAAFPKRELQPSAGTTFLKSSAYS